MYVFNIQTQSSRPQSINLHRVVLHTVVLQGNHIFRTGDTLQDGDCTLRQRVQLRQIRTKDLNRDIAANAGQHLGHAHFNRLSKAVRDARKILHRCADRGDNRCLIAMPPLFARRQHKEHIGLVKSHRVQADLVGASACDGVLNLGYIVEHRAFDAAIDQGAFFQTD